MPGTLIVSAFEPEIAPLRARVARWPRVTLLPVGIGAVDASAGAARAIADGRPERVIFVGTAGVYARGRAAAPLGTAVVPGEIVCVSTAALGGDGYLPEPMIVRAATSSALRTALAGQPADDAPSVACPLAITRSARLARQIADATGAELENLELFAVARAAASVGLEFAAVLGVANRVGPTAHREWLANHRRASRAACTVVLRYLQQVPRTRRKKPG